jgi:hypothetical protein
MALRQAAKTLTYPFLRLGRGYDSLARNYPQSTAIITTTIKTSAADAFAQLVRHARKRVPAVQSGHLTRQIRPMQVVEKRDGLDWRRHGMFVGFG